MFISTVELPPLFVAVMVYCVLVNGVVGVPLMAPVVVSKEIPLGKLPVCDQVVGVPPLYVGVMVVIAELTLKIRSSGL